MKDVPIWEKSNLTLEEAAAYSGIGINKLRSLSDKEHCQFVLWVGSKRSSSGASWMNTRSECTRFENVPDIFQNVLQRMAFCGTMNTEQRSFLYRNVERSNAHGNKSEYERKDKARVVLRKGESSAKMASTISVGLPRMASGILFMPRP